MKAEMVTVLVRADNPEKNKIGVYKTYKRILHIDSDGEYYVKINRMRAYVYYTSCAPCLVKYWR